MKRIITAVILLISTSALAAPAQKPVLAPQSGEPAQKIGIVDLQRAVSESKAGIAARAKILQRTEQLNADLKSQVADSEKLKAELDKDGAKLPLEGRLEKERLIQKKARELQYRQREAQEEIKQLEADSLNFLLSRFGVILAKLIDDGVYTIIFERGTSATYFSRQVDVTPTVIKLSDEADAKQSK